MLLAGTVGRNPVVAKCLLDHSPAWAERFQHEIAAYRAFVQTMLRGDDSGPHNVRSRQRRRHDQQGQLAVRSP